MQHLHISTFVKTNSPGKKPLIIQLEDNLFLFNNELGIVKSDRLQVLDNFFLDFFPERQHSTAGAMVALASAFLIHTHIHFYFALHSLDHIQE